MALNQACKQALQVRNILTELRRTRYIKGNAHTIIVYEDNQLTIQITTSIGV